MSSPKGAPCLLQGMRQAHLYPDHPQGQDMADTHKTPAWAQYLSMSLR